MKKKMSTLQPGVHKSQEQGHLGDHILYGGTWYLWMLIMDLASLHLSGTLNFLMVPRFTQNLCTHAYNYDKFMNILCKIMTKTVHLQWYVNRSLIT